MNIKNLEITTKIGCYNMCSYCPQTLLMREYKKRSSEKYMTLDTFVRCIGKVNDDVNIGFTGMCEPFLNKNCVEMIEIASRDHPVYVSTTLVGLRIGEIQRLEKINFKSFELHLPGKSEENIIVNEEYVNLVRGIVKSNINNKKYHFHGESLNPALSFVKAEKADIVSRGGNVEHIKYDSKLGPVKCKRGFAHPVLLPNGDVILCCMDYGLTAVLGNLLTQSLKEIYSGKGFNDVIQAAKKDSGSICHSCHRSAKTKEIMFDNMKLGIKKIIPSRFHNTVKSAYGKFVK